MMQFSHRDVDEITDLTEQKSENQPPINLSDYQLEVSITEVDGDFKSKLTAYSMGLAGKTGDLVKILKGVVFHKNNINLTEVAEELGDILCCCAALANTLELDLDNVIRLNLKKLNKHDSNAGN